MELQYKITENDVKRVNKSVMWTYFIPYIVAAVSGIAVGICATVLSPRTEILVLGIILIVLGAILTVCSLLLLFTSKSFVVSALLTSDDTIRNVELGEDKITVKTEAQSDIFLDYVEITKVKNKGDYVAAFIGKEQVFILKPDEANSAEQITSLLQSKRARYASSDKASEAQENSRVESDAAQSDEPKQSEETAKSDEAVSEETDQSE